MKVINLDKLFDKYISDYVYDNIGRVKPEEIEDNIPVLYDKFGDEPLAELDGKTPNEYYRAFSTEELVGCLEEHTETGVGVPDFLVKALIEEGRDVSLVQKKLRGECSEEFTMYLLSVLQARGEADVDVCLEFVLYSESFAISELSTEILDGCAEAAKEKILDVFSSAPEDRKVNLAEILSNTVGDERVFAVLSEEFAKHGEHLALYAGFLAKFGDDRALPLLTSAIENENIKYADFEELRFAIEVLGGSYDKKRDFSKDASYKKIKSAGIKRQ